MHVYRLFVSMKPLLYAWKICDKQHLKALATVLPKFSYPTQHTSPISQSKDIFQNCTYFISHAREGNSERRQQLGSEEKWQRGKSKARKQRRRGSVGATCVM